VRRRAVLSPTTTVVSGARIRNESTSRAAITIGAHSGLLGEVTAGVRGRIQVGEWCILREDTRLVAMTSITIGDYVGIGRLVDILACGDGGASDVEPGQPQDPERRARICASVRRGPIVIEDDVWVASKVTILGGVRIGRAAIIGSGALVLDDVPAGAIVVGAPARVVRMRSPAAEPAPDNRPTGSQASHGSSG
jgi:acetyltransferase-like isoleucine patch superfamily enzyme